MSLNIELLKRLITNLPDDDFTVEYKNNDDIVSPLSHIVEIDMEGKRLILKK